MNEPSLGHMPPPALSFHSGYRLPVAYASTGIILLLYSTYHTVVLLTVRYPRSSFRQKAQHHVQCSQARAAVNLHSVFNSIINTEYVGVVCNATAVGVGTFSSTYEIMNDR
jgi:hypothetical protein